MPVTPLHHAVREVPRVASRRSDRLRTSLTLLAVLALLAVGTISSVMAATATLSLDPTVAPVGTTVSVDGSGFKPRERVEITFGDATVGVPTFRVSNDGTFEEPLVVPAVAPGTYTVTARRASNEAAIADAILEVVAPEVPAPTPTPPADPTPTTIPTPTPAPTPTGTPPPTGSAVLLAAGDIASCSNDNDEATARILDATAGIVIPVGDLAYENGTATEFAQCYDPTWGRHKARTKPAPGNHEYHTTGATGYYGYFGAAAGDPAKGYYAFDAGAWRVYALNSNCSDIGGCDAGSAQVTWLRADLAANPRSCVLAYWHHPRFSSGEHGNTPNVQPLWQALDDAGAEVVLSGHDHIYERFAPQDASGAADPSGLTEIVAGTGGRSLYSLISIKPNSEVRNNSTFGVLQLTLGSNGLDYRFLPVAGSTFTDSGSIACH